MTTRTDHRAGDAVPPLERRIGLSDMVAYAGATWDWYRLHYDPEFVRAARVPGPVVDGQVFGALLVEQIQDWLGPRCFVHKLDFTFKALVFAEETVRCEGTVVEVGEDHLVLEQRVVVIGPDGGVDRVAAAPARARVLLGTADGPGA
ncbi:MaoC/PaaZ C-terminal domain-containing protein [Actinocorallia populi]|uniref:MaoC/PaaZ C-terminal domain-containing protein n=1 Tax=Actinocorallia populi TaxID=2079200 RepID=UPI000D09394A|nr:MaoC/PaaZ C-terminal domain-containing protein [Actinocorallia populi]